MPKTQAELLSDVEESRQRANFKRHLFLRTSGWIYTCKTPGCYWLWQKALPDGRVIMTSEDLAERMERHLMGD